MLFIPILYGGFFLGSIWNPYGSTKNLKVAVVNEDTGAVLDGRAINVGAELMTELKTNRDIGWQFVDTKRAETGLRQGDYYMVLTVPTDFSAHTLTVTQEKPTPSTIPYKTSPARNYISSLLTKQAAEHVTKQVSTSVSKAYLQVLFTNIKSLSHGLDRAAIGASELANGSQNLTVGLASYTHGVSDVARGEKTLAGGVEALADGSLALKTGLGDLQTSLPNATKIQQLEDGVTAIQTGIATLNTATQQPDKTILAEQKIVAADAEMLQQQLVSYKTNISKAGSSLAALQDGVASGQTAISVDPIAMLAVINSSQHIAASSVTLLADMQTLQTMLEKQQATLQTSIQTLASGMDALSPGLQAALKGYTGITSGTQALSVGAAKLYDGSNQAINGAQQLVLGTTKLDTASTALTNGASQITAGNETLASALTDAANRLKLQPTGDMTAAHIVSPVVSKDITTESVPNYGYALSPYVLSLGLFVGAFVFSVIYPVRRFFDNPRNARAWWFSKISVAFAVAVGQALILIAIMTLGLHLQPDHTIHFVWVTLLTSVTYMSIILLLTIMLDNVGRFLAMVLLVLQLGSAGGVFPIVLSAGFFQAVNPWVPMTYSIYAYRHAISSGLTSGEYIGSVIVLVIAAVAANIALIAFLRLHGMRHFSHESIDS